MQTIPSLVSPWTRIVEYPGHHLNDFCLFRGQDDRWHAIGIMGTGTWASETSLFHCSSTNLLGPYEHHPPLLTELEQGPTTNDAPQKHAPYVVWREGRYYMFFRRPFGTNLLVTSPDAFSWSKVPELVFEEHDARDSCIQRFGGIYHHYYCQWQEIDEASRSCILLRKSRDLRQWSDARPVFVDTTHESGHSRLESPFVVNASGAYWLFVRNRLLDATITTQVYSSHAPDAFRQINPVCLDHVHAPELVQAGGHWYIARVSGPPELYPTEAPSVGWVDIAKIAFD